MSTDEAVQDVIQADAEEPQQPPTQPAAMATGNKKRPRLDLTGGERKRGKSIFGLVLGTLNKAKIEDKERNASEAAKKRQLIDQRLQNKLRKETDSVRRAEEAKKDKTAANRKEEDLQLKDSIYKLRRKRLPLLANFLVTSDVIPPEGSSPPPPSKDPLAGPPRAHPPPLYYLPAILLPAQESFIARRKAEVSEAAEKEWELFAAERATGITEINELRQRVAEEDAKKKAEREQKEEKEEMDTDPVPPPPPVEPTAATEDKPAEPTESAVEASKDVEMDVDDVAPTPAANESAEQEKKSKEEAAAAAAAVASANAHGDDDDAVEY